MSYRSSEKTRQRKDAKRTAMMQAALKIFAENGYHAATVRDVVNLSNVAIGTFYFYFPDKETLFGYLYDETADFLFQTIRQAAQKENDFANQVAGTVDAYLKIALYEPAIVQLLLMGGIGTIPSLGEKHNQFRERMIGIWRKLIESGCGKGLLPMQESRTSAEFIVGGLDTLITQLLLVSNPDSQRAMQSISVLILRSLGYAEQ